MPGTTYRVDLSFTNVQTGESTTMRYQFDPETLDVTKWTASWPAVKGQLDTLRASSAQAGKEPLVW